MPRIRIEDLIDVAAWYVELMGGPDKVKRQGDQIIGCCPWHDDAHASFSACVEGPKKGMYICRSECGGGNMLKAWARTYFGDFKKTKEAYKDFMEKHGGPASSSSSASAQASPKKRQSKKGAGKESSSSIITERTLPESVLDKPAIPLPLKYVDDSRKWSRDVIDAYQLRYHPKEKRIWIPIRDEAGRLVNVRRYLPGAKEGEKFFNWPRDKDGHSYGRRRLFPYDQIEKARKDNAALILCEGESDCLCGLSHGLHCITQTAGASSWDDSWNALFRGLDVLIVYDHDEAGRRGAARVAKYLPKYASRVEILLWPEGTQEKGDLTDWFKADNTAEALLSLPRETAEPPEEDKAPDEIYAREIEELNRTYAMVDMGSKTCILCECKDPVFGRPDIALKSIPDFKWLLVDQRIPNPDRGRGQRKDISISQVWLESPKKRKYKGIVFDPLVSDNGYYNLWRGFAVEPKEGDWDLYRDHLYYVICGGREDIFFYVMAWMADAVQNLGKKRPGTSIVLRGEQGTGKGCFVTIFGRIFGNHFLHITNQGQLTGRFNAHLKNAALVFCDEGIWAGDRSAEGVLKGMVTEDVIQIEPKGRDPFAVKNHIRLIIASNNEWVVPAGMHERRFCVLDVANDHRQDREYFTKIFEQMDEKGGTSALLYDLLDLDISPVDLRAIPRTAALFDQAIHTLPSAKKFWFELLRRGTVFCDDSDWNSLVSAGALHSSYLEFARNHGDRFPMIDKQFGKEIRQLCPSVNRVYRTVEMGGKREWFLDLPGLDQCRNDFSEAIGGMNINWDGDDVN